MVLGNWDQFIGQSHHEEHWNNCKNKDTKMEEIGWKTLAQHEAWNNED